MLFMGILHASQVSINEEKVSDKGGAMFFADCSTLMWWWGCLTRLW
jgi:hypothetical protein